MYFSMNLMISYCNNYDYVDFKRLIHMNDSLIFNIYLVINMYDDGLG